LENDKDVLHKAIIKVVELDKNMSISIKPQAHPARNLWYVLEGGMGLVNWDWKNQNPFEFVDTFRHFVAIEAFTIAFQAIVGRWYYIGVV